ncbi:MAG: hypothetical protein RIS64_2785 [Bacteroidota bacterium]|jgi:hypothetical protein
MSKHSKTTYVSLFLIGFSVGSLAAQGYETDSIEMKLVLSAKSIGRNIHDLPKQFSLKSVCPTPEDQGVRPTCVSWAIAYAAYTIQKRLKSPFSAVFLAHYLHRLKGWDKPVALLDGLQQLKQRGTLTNYINNPKPAPSAKDSSEALKNRIHGYQAIPLNELEKYIKNALTENKPVVIGIKIEEKAFRDLPKGSIWQGCSGKQIGHAVCIMGYDDAKQAFQVINSWGIRWADDGFGWISYTAIQQHCVSAFTITP